MTLQIRHLTPTIGAEIIGVDLARVGDADFPALRQALLDHFVIVFRDQQLKPEDHLAFARRFGELEPPHPVFKGLPGYPQISVLENRGNEGVYNDEWHTDVTFRASPALGSILYARVIPESGGDTLWANMVAAYEALAKPIKSMIDTTSLAAAPMDALPTTARSFWPARTGRSVWRKFKTNFRQSPIPSCASIRRPGGVRCS